MATDAPNSSPNPEPSLRDHRPCCSEKTLAYLVLRLLLGTMLLLAGVEKFKSSDSPYFYSFKNWHDDKDASGEVIKQGRWWPIVKVIYESGGLNNPEVFQFGTFPRMVLRSIEEDEKIISLCLEEPAIIFLLNNL